MTNKLLLAYCKENEISAHEIERELKPVGFVFEHLVCQSTEDYTTFNQSIQQQALPVLLLVSDNYLKSLPAMYQALPTVQSMINAGKLQPIVVDGYYLGGEDGSFEKVPTQFDRIGQIIKYMNHWQEEYLNLRQRNKDSQGEQKALIEKQLKITRGVSTQIGEFLRYLRETEYWEYQLLKENHFEPIFKIFGNEIAFQEYVAQYAAKSELSHASNIPSPAGVELEPVPQLVVVEEEPEEEPPMAALEIDATQIPGADLLDSSPVPQESSQLPDLEIPSDPLPLRIEPEEVLPKEEEPLPEEKVFLDLQNDLEGMIEEVAEEEALLNGNYEEGDSKEDKQKKYDILQSIFDDDEEDEELALAEGNMDEDIEEDNQPDIDVIPSEENIDQGAIEHLKTLAQDAETHNDLLLAKSYYEKINSLYPGIEEINYKLGILTSSCFTNQDKQAAKYLKKTLKINPANNQARYQLGIILAERLDKPQKAIKQFIQTLEQQPDHPFANYDLALLYHRLGDLETATDYYEQAFHLNPELKTAENDLAFNFQETEEVANQKKALHESLYPELHLKEEVAKEEIEEEEVEEEIPMPALNQPQDQKTVLITGATSGIGLATAHIFAQNGYRLILTGRREERLEALREKLKTDFNTSSLSLNFDVRNRAATHEALAQLIDEWGQVDILINNAGLAKGFAPIHEGDIDDWETMIDTNVKGLLYMTRAIAPKMVKNRKGHIINVASTAGKEVYPNGNVYCASKFAVDALTQAMRLDLHKHQIRVSQVAPGHVEETEFALVRFDGDADRAKIYDDFQPLTSRDVAETIYFIATRPPHVNIQDVLLMGTQQASSNHIDRSGRS